MTDQSAIASALQARGILAAAWGQAQQAARLLGIAEQITLQGGFRIQYPGGKWVDQLFLVTKKEIGEAAWKREYQAGQKFATNSQLTMEQAVAYALESRDV